MGVWGCCTLRAGTGRARSKVPAPRAVGRQSGDADQTRIALQGAPIGSMNHSWPIGGPRVFPHTLAGTTRVAPGPDAPPARPPQPHRARIDAGGTGTAGRPSGRQRPQQAALRGAAPAARRTGEWADTGARVWAAQASVGQPACRAGARSCSAGVRRCRPAQRMLRFSALASPDAHASGAARLPTPPAPGLRRRQQCWHASVQPALSVLWCAARH